MRGSIALRSAGAALAFLGLLAHPVAAGLISHVGAIPNPFSPNADGVYDSTAVYYSLSEADLIYVTVRDSSFARLDTLSVAWQEAGEYSHWWDGKVGGELMPDGGYHFVIEAVLASEDSCAAFTLDTTAPAITDLTAEPGRFTPDGDDVGDSLQISVILAPGGAADQMTAGIVDVLGEPVRELYNGSCVTPLELRWDGTNDAGAAAADTLYLVLVSAIDPAGNASERSVLVDLDTEPPRLAVDDADSVSGDVHVYAPEVSLSGKARDRAGVTRVEVSLNDGGSWSDVDAVTATQGSHVVQWEHAVACTACAPDVADETISVSIRAYDGTSTAEGHGHVNGTHGSIPILSFSVVFDVVGPAHVETGVSDADTIYFPGEKVTIETQWDAPGYDIVADFSEVDDTFETGDAAVADAGAGRYTVTYTISEQAAVPVLGAPVTISAGDGYHDPVEITAATLSVLAAPLEPSAVTIDRNSFDPSDGDAVTVDLGSYLGDISVDIYNMAGTLVGSLEADGASEVTWSGENANGDLVASGVYFLRIRTDDKDVVRKVAVVK
jgi:flagellar hook assembly protein FlgD